MGMGALITEASLCYISYNLLALADVIKFKLREEKERSLQCEPG
jgi:hypothetical protein